MTTTPSMLQHFCESTDDYNRLLQEASLENYYSLIQGNTFESDWFSISEPVATLLVQANQNKTPMEVLKQSSVIQQFATECDAMIQKVRGGKEGHVFIRLSTLSPKDAVCHLPGFKEYTKRVYEEQILLKEGRYKDLFGPSFSYGTPMNRWLYSMFVASIQFLKIQSSDEILTLLVKSARAQQELEELISKESSYRKSDKPLNLIVRKWYHFDMATEFRCFFHNKKWTAMTSYAPMLWFPEISLQKQQIESLIRKFFESDTFQSIAATLPQKHFIVDVMLLPRKDTQESNIGKMPLEYNHENYQVKIIELNAFAEFAGACLFDWAKAYDNGILTGKNEFEFRTVTEEPRFASHILQKDFKILVESLVKESQ